MIVERDYRELLPKLIDGLFDNLEEVFDLLVDAFKVAGEKPSVEKVKVVRID